MSDYISVDAGDVEVRLEEIRSKADDDEAAHSLEDKLRGDVLWTIATIDTSRLLSDATGTSEMLREAVELARLALATDDIHFARWCA